MHYIKQKFLNPQISRNGSCKNRLSPFGHLFRLAGWWFGFTGLYAAFAVCPFCGRPGCPVGMASASTIGAFFALCINDWKRFFAWIRQKRNGRKRVQTDASDILLIAQLEGNADDDD
jgi:hypothetical protein